MLVVTCAAGLWGQRTFSAGCSHAAGWGGVCHTGHAGDVCVFGVGEVGVLALLVCVYVCTRVYVPALDFWDVGEVQGKI